jgi:hypothetical protein
MPWKGLLRLGAVMPGADWRKSVHELSASGMIQELFQLLTIFKADQKYVETFERNMSVRSSREDPISNLRLSLIEPIVTRLLIDSAAKNRWRADMEIDTNREEGRPEPETGPWSMQVGRLCATEKATWEPLSLREGCNKIIHADDIQPEFASAENDEQYLTGLIRTIGRLGKNKWEAEIDVTNYVRASLFNIYGGIDFPRGWISL